MNYNEAEEKSLQVEWVTQVCHSGEECWCRMITTKEPLIYDEDEVFYISQSGQLTKEVAEYLVNLHNEKINKK